MPWERIAWKDKEYDTFEHVLFEGRDADISLDTFKRHILLEFLDSLKVIEYTRGYDGIYYDVSIKVRNGR